MLEHFENSKVKTYILWNTFLAKLFEYIATKKPLN